MSIKRNQCLKLLQKAQKKVSSESRFTDDLGADSLGASHFRQLPFTEGNASSETGSHRQSPNPKSKIQNPKWDAPDSLDLVELVMQLEEEFDLEISDEVAERLKTVGQAVNHIAREIKN